ncbi:MAG: DNA repair protein RecO [Candidatus Saccharimonadales bacterium]
MNQLVTSGIILGRTDYGEADRILTVLTPDQGKIRLMAKGVRRAQSKLAGGIELFSVSQISFIRGRSQLGTLISSRMQKHYGNIVKNIERTTLGYELIKLLNKNIEDEPEAEYFELLKNALATLDDLEINLRLIRFWFFSQLLRLAGHTPNLNTDIAGQKLDAAKTYDFNFEDMAFSPKSAGLFTANHIKFLRLAFSKHQPKTLAQVRGGAQLVNDCLLPIEAMLHAQLRI